MILIQTAETNRRIERNGHRPGECCSDKGVKEINRSGQNDGNPVARTYPELF